MSSTDLKDLSIEKSEKSKNLDKIFWLKVVLSLLFGIVYGLILAKGLAYFLIYILVTTLISTFYFNNYIIDKDSEEEYQSEVIMEGLNVAVPLFILSWTVIYTLNTLN